MNTFDIDHAIFRIEASDGVGVDIKPKALAKFGRYDNLGTSFETVQEHGGTETMLEANSMDTVVSSDAGDDQVITVEGHSRDGSGNLTFVVQTATLDGTNNVTLAIPLARGTRIKNSGATSFAGTVSVKAGGTTYVTAGPTFNRSQKAATSTSQDDYWILTTITGSVLKKTSATVDFSLQIREQGGVFQEVYGFGASSTSSSIVHRLEPAITVKPNSDIRIQARASTTAVEVIARVAGYLVLVDR